MATTVQKAKSLRHFKQENEERLASEKLLVDRRRNLLVLALEYLTTCRLPRTFEALEREGGIACSKFAPADGVDLPHILREFEAYHEIKHNKKAAFYKQIERSQSADASSGPRRGGSGGRGGGPPATGRGGGRGRGAQKSSAGEGDPACLDDGTSPSSERKSIRQLREDAKKTPVFHQPNRPKEQPAASSPPAGGGKQDDDDNDSSRGLLFVGPARVANSTDEAERERRNRRMSYNPSQMPAGLGVPLALKGRGAGPVTGGMVSNGGGASLLLLLPRTPLPLPPRHVQSPPSLQPTPRVCWHHRHPHKFVQTGGGAGREAGGGGGGAAAAGGGVQMGDRAALVSKLPYAVDSESHKLAMTISRDVHVSVSGITFDDVVGLEGAKQLLQEAVVFPVK
jgi:hypothetical protein